MSDTYEALQFDNHHKRKIASRKSSHPVIIAIFGILIASCTFLYNFSKLYTEQSWSWIAIASLFALVIIFFIAQALQTSASAGLRSRAAGQSSQGSSTLKFIIGFVLIMVMVYAPTGLAKILNPFPLWALVIWSIIAGICAAIIYKTGMLNRRKFISQGE
ncbi:hypothetical protein EML15_09590 [Corynebacterium sp. sy017]|uniref:hypothetical protein n=1 Tax=unclassified Corynebacterium TaxID=2624378 RepID=UPI001185581B|nr:MULTISPECIES: hypothetical protein [unclassified Corynebacterium]MBP3089390.1 hypothetical protein [Corynebacterium sp. sy017]TSD90920.1 hypothetical protein ELY17_09010 [Corynebacterium sp. SY003]